ncbi:MAG: hypothetical protein NC048_02290 [Bacteroides sp.]|nr:hypothetical protein [Ruminococcus flavefaciens]MCM1554306.1 hypothetical protein [Bacteroides sp.]
MTDMVDNSEQDTFERDKRIERKEEHYGNEIWKYFDRINDKLFSCQLFFLTGYVTLVAVPRFSLCPFWLAIPIACLIRLMSIDYHMMKFSRKLSKFSELTTDEIDKLAEHSSKATSLSLEVILETVIVMILFIIFLKKSLP